MWSLMSRKGYGSLVKFTAADTFTETFGYFASFTTSSMTGPIAALLGDLGRQAHVVDDQRQARVLLGDRQETLVMLSGAKNMIGSPAFSASGKIQPA